MASYNWSKVTALSAFGHDIIRITRTATGELIWQKEDPTPIPEDMLTFTAVGEPSTIKLDKAGTEGTPYDVSLEYCVDNGAWTAFIPESTTISLDPGQKACLRSTIEDPNGTNTTPFSKDYYNFYQFAMTGKIAASGNIQYLIDKTGRRTSVADYCYKSLFNSCSSLTTAPTLPVTQLADRCYSGMFSGCSSLQAAPQLPATQLAYQCYSNMFYNCSSLIAAPPQLSAIQLTNDCYAGMFYNCTSLQAAPQLPATTLATNCYISMFRGCTSLTQAPVLSVTTLKFGCYQCMFQDCSSLTAAPELPATTLAGYCYAEMFQGCSSLTAAPKLPATSLADHCYFEIFLNDTNVNDIYIPNLTESAYNTEKAAKSSGDLGREGLATFHYKV